MSNIDPLLEALTPKTDWYVVLRPFQGDGDSRYVRGEVVDASRWIHRRRLVDLRYIAPLPHGAAVPDLDGEGRRIVVLDEQSASEIHHQKLPAEPAPVTTEVLAEESPSRPTPVRREPSKPRGKAAKKA